jgi:hypothetical protein
MTRPPARWRPCRQIWPNHYQSSLYPSISFGLRRFTMNAHHKSSSTHKARQASSARITAEPLPIALGPRQQRFANPPTRYFAQQPCYHISFTEIKGRDEMSRVYQYNMHASFAGNRRVLRGDDPNMVGNTSCNDEQKEGMIRKDRPHESRTCLANSLRAGSWG